MKILNDDQNLKYEFTINKFKKEKGGREIFNFPYKTKLLLSAFSFIVNANTDIKIRID